MQIKEELQIFPSSNSNPVHPTPVSSPAPTPPLRTPQSVLARCHIQFHDQDSASSRSFRVIASLPIRVSPTLSSRFLDLAVKAGCLNTRILFARVDCYQSFPISSPSSETAKPVKRSAILQAMNSTPLPLENSCGGERGVWVESHHGACKMIRSSGLTGPFPAV